MRHRSRNEWPRFLFPCRVPDHNTHRSTSNRAVGGSLLSLDVPSVLIPKLYPAQSPKAHGEEESDGPNQRDDQTDGEETKIDTGHDKNR